MSNVSTNFLSPQAIEAPYMKLGFNGPSGFRGDVWKCWRRRTTDACLYYKLTYEWAKKLQPNRIADPISWIDEIMLSYVFLHIFQTLFDPGAVSYLV